MCLATCFIIKKRKVTNKSIYQDVDFARHRVKVNKFSNNKESSNFKIKKVHLFVIFRLGFFPKDNLMQIDKIPRNMKRAFNYPLQFFQSQVLRKEKRNNFFYNLIDSNGNMDVL